MDDADVLGLAVTDADGRLVEVNRVLADILARRPEDLRGTAYCDVVHPDDRTVEGQRMADLVAGRTPAYALEERYVRTGGEVRWVQVRATAGGEGGDVSIVRRVLDVTERRRAEEARERAEERFRRIFELCPMGIVLAGDDRRIVRVNPAFCQMLGYREEELAGRSLADLTHPDDVDLNQPLARRVSAGEIPSYEIEKRYLRRDGEIVWARLHAVSIDEGPEGSRYRLAIVEDVTETHEAEAARREFDALKDAFLRVVSHDLQSPLVTIAGLAEILASPDAGMEAAEQRRILGRIAHHAGRLQHMVATFLDLDRLYRTGSEPQRRPVEIPVLVGRAAEDIDVGDHVLTIEAATVTVQVDPDQVGRILENLLANAVAHTPPGTPLWLGVSATADSVEITVADAGPGLPDDLKERVFELFSTGDPQARRTGVGLWVVRRLAELHGGRAWVEDRPGGGASFRVELPTGAGNNPLSA